VTSSHVRNTGPMTSSPRCGARTRRGTPCQAPSVVGKRRCRMHCVAKGVGAPPGNRNALKHGMYSRDEIAEQRAVRELIRQPKALLREIAD
jgi:hypothetical protein